MAYTVNQGGKDFAMWTEDNDYSKIRTCIITTSSAFSCITDRFPETSDDSQVSENSTSFSPTAIWCPVTRRHRAVSQIQPTYNVRITCLKVLRIERHPRTIPQSEYYPIPRKQVVSHTQLHNVRNHARIQRAGAGGLDVPSH